MLEIRPSCEHCRKELPYNSTDAMICSFECTFCLECAHHIFENVCPNCGGGFTSRPIRPQHLLDKYPPSEKRVEVPKDLDKHRGLLLKYREVSPENR